MKLEKSAACRCHGSSIEYTPEKYDIEYIPEKNIVTVEITGPDGYNYFELEGVEAAKFGADIVAAATGVKE